MAIENRKVTCDVCSYSEVEALFGTGFPGWVTIQGIGAVEPEEGESIQNKHREMYLCPEHKIELAELLDNMQESNSFVEVVK